MPLPSHVGPGPRIVLLLLMALLAIAPSQAQTPYQDPAGRFTLAVPRGWTLANREPLVLTRQDASVTVTMAEGTDADGVVQSVLGQVQGQWSRWQELKRATTMLGGRRGPLVFASGSNPKGVPAFFRIAAAPAGQGVLVLMASVPQERYADAKAAVEAIDASVAFAGGARGAEPSAPAAGTPDRDRRLAALDRALEAGVLTQEEYDAKKRALTAEVATPPPAPPPSANRAWLGVASRNLETQDQEMLRVREGALVAQVAPRSPAEQAGVQPGDVVIGVDGTPVVDAATLIQAIGRKHPGDAVVLRVVRRGQTGELRAQLQAPPR